MNIDLADLQIYVIFFVLIFFLLSIMLSFLLMSLSLHAVMKSKGLLAPNRASKGA